MEWFVRIIRTARRAAGATALFIWVISIVTLFISLVNTTGPTESSGEMDLVATLLFFSWCICVIIGLCQMMVDERESWWSLVTLVSFGLLAWRFLAIESGIPRFLFSEHGVTTWLWLMMPNYVLAADFVLFTAGPVVWDWLVTEARTHQVHNVLTQVRQIAGMWALFLWLVSAVSLLCLLALAIGSIGSFQPDSWSIFFILVWLVTAFAAFGFMAVNEGREWWNGIAVAAYLSLKYLTPAGSTLADTQPTAEEQFLIAVFLTMPAWILGLDFLYFTATPFLWQRLVRPSIDWLQNHLPIDRLL